MKTAIKTIASIAIFIALICTIAKGMSHSPDFAFDKDLEGNEYEIIYATYLREEPRADSTKHGYLEVGEKVNTTGSKAHMFCLLTTCDCGGGHMNWIQVSSGSETFWIKAEAIGQ